MADRIAELYQIASKKGVLAEGLTEDMFREQTATDEGLRSFYDYAQNNGMSLTPWDTFRGKARGEIMNEAPSAQQVKQHLNPLVKDNPAPTTEEEYQRELERQDIAQGVRTPLSDRDKNEPMLRNAEQMRRNAAQMAQHAGQMTIPKPSLSLSPQDGSIAAAAQRMQRERQPEIRKQTIAKNMLDETAQSLGELQRADREAWFAQGENMTPTQKSYIAQAYKQDPYLEAANNVLFNAEVRMSDAKRQNGISWKNIGEGLVEFGKDTGKHLLTKLEGMASFGLSDVRNAVYQRNVLKKVADADAFDNPETVLTPQEKALYDATITSIAVEIARQNDTSRWSKAGQITADMIPFVEDIMIGNALFKGFGNAGREAIKKGVEKHVRNKLSKWLLTNVGDVAMSAGESAATAAILPHTYSEMYKNTAQVDMDKVGMDGDFRMKLGGIKEQDFGKSWAQAYGNEVKELFTETGGNFRLIGRALIDNPIGKKILETPFGMVLKRFEGAKGGAGSRFASMTMYHGVLGEWLEELEGAIYDGNLKDFFTADTQLPMLLSFAVPAAFTGGLNATQQALYQAKYDQAGKRIDKLIDASSYVGPDKNTIKGQILATLYQTPTENLPQAIGMCVEQVYPEEYKALMEGAPEKGNKAAELSYALKDYLTSGTVLTIFDPDMIGGQIADVQAHRQQMREQAEQNAQAEVQSISHADGNIYHVGIKGKEGAEGYAFRGDLDIVPNQDGTLSTRGRDLITIKMTDGTVEQVPADEVTLLDAPTSAADRVQAVADHLFAQYANNDLFQIGDKVHIMQDGQPSEDSSTIVNITDDGVEVEIIDPNGQPNTTVIPHEQAAEMLSKDETGTEDGIVTYQTQDGNTVRLRDMGDGTFASIVSDGETPEIFTEDELAQAGAVRADQSAEKEVPTTQQEATTPEQTPSYPQDEEGNPEWGQIEVPQAAQILYDTFKQNNTAAISYADDQLKEAEKVQRQAAKQKSHSLNIAQRIAEDEQNAAFKAQADAAVKYWLDVKLSIGQIKTAEEQAAKEAQQLAMQQAREQRGKTEEGTVTAPTMAERYAAADKIEGNTGTMTLPDGRELSGRYMLIAPQGVTPSHDVTKNYQRSEGYPMTSNGQSINDRDYTSDQEEQQKVQSIAQNFNGNAIKNMPVISDEGLVYNGNGRMMAGQLAALNGTDAAYTQSLMNNAAQYGFTPEQVASIPNARVVFQLDERLPYSTQSLAIFNEQETQTQSNTGKAAGYARKLTPQAISEVLAAVDGFNTIDAFFNDPKAPQTLINNLISAGIIAQREKAEMVDGEKLSATGRERLSNILFGTVFDNETIRLMGDDAALKNSILRALPQILDNKSLGEFSLEADINDAIRLLYEVRKAKMPFRSFVSQTVIAEDGQTHTAAEDYSPYQLLLAEEMTEGGVDAFRDVLTLYNDQARMAIGGQADIFGNLMTETELKNLILERYGKEPTETERPNAGRQAEPAVQSTPASNEPAAQLTKQQVDAIEEAFSLWDTHADESVYHLLHTVRDIAAGNKEITDSVDEIEKALDDEGLADIDMVDEAAEELRRRLQTILQREITPKQEAPKQAKSYPQRIFARNYYKDNGAREIAHGIKNGDLDSINEAAKDMYEALKPYIDDMVAGGGITFIPVPSRTGKADSTFKLATLIWQRITEKTPQWRDGTVNFRDVLEGNERESLYDLKKAGRTIPEDFFGFRLKGELPTNGTIILVDGVEATGATMDAAREVVGSDAISLVYAYDDTIEKEQALASAEADTDTNPTDAQKKAENYKQGHVTLWGLPITIENPKGSTRRGTDANGKKWEQLMHNTYGKIRRTEGVDGDHIDVFIGPNLNSERVFVVDQLNQDTGEFDEHKVMLGFDSIDEAQAAYLSNYEKGWRGMGPVTEVTMDEFKKWIDSSHRKTKMFSEYKSVKAEAGQSQEQSAPTNEEQLRDELAEELRKFDMGERSPMDENLVYDEEDMRNAVTDILKRYNSPKLQAAMDAITATLERQRAAGVEWLDAEDEEQALIDTVREVVGDKATSVEDRSLYEQAKVNKAAAERGKPVSKMKKDEILAELEQYAKGNLYDMTPRMAKRIMSLAKKYGKNLPEPLANMADNAALLTGENSIEDTKNAKNSKKSEENAENILIYRKNFVTLQRQRAEEAAAKRGEELTETEKYRWDWLLNNIDRIIDEYKAQVAAARAKAEKEGEIDHGNKIDPDKVREFFKPIGYVRYNVPDYRLYEKALIEALYYEMLRETVAGGNTKLVILTGVGGAGKSTATKQNQHVIGLIHDAGLVFDAALNSFDSLQKRIESAKRAGIKEEDITVIPVYNNAEQAWDNALSRGVETGRVLSVQYFLKAFADNAGKIEKVNANYPAITIIPFNNEHNRGNGQPTTLEAAKAWDYTVTPEIIDKILEIYESYINQGRLNEDRIAAIGRNLSDVKVEGEGVAAESARSRLAKLVNRVSGQEGGREAERSEVSGRVRRPVEKGGAKTLTAAADVFPRFDVGAKVLYKKQYHAVIEEINYNDATYILSYPNALGIDTKLIGIKQEDLEDDGGTPPNNPPSGPAPTKPTKKEKKSEFGAKNTIVTQDEAADLTAQLKDLLGEDLSLFAVADPMRDAERSAKIMQVGTRLAMYYIEGGARKFSDFCQAMVKRVGDVIRPYLRSLYMAARYNPAMAKYMAEMDDAGIVESFDVDNFVIEEEKPVEEEKPAEQPTFDSPMFKQFKAIKEQYPDATLLFRVGDFYELYASDAEEASKILGITITKRGDGMAFAGFPFHALDTYLPKLVRAGKRVGICDQLENPKEAKKEVKRGVTELVETPKVESPEVAEPESVTDNQEPTIPEPNVVTDTVGEITESKHTKTGATIWVVKPLERVSNDEFKVLKRRAKENNGYYSTFAKGFVFNSDNDATRFNNISDAQTTTEQSSSQGEAAINKGEAVAAEAASIERDGRDQSGAEGELSTEVVTPSDDELVERQQAVKEIDAAIEQIDEQLPALEEKEAVPEEEPAELPANPTVSDLLEQAKKRSKARKKKAEQTLDLFADEEDVNPPLAEQTQPIEDNGNTEVRNDGRRESRSKKAESAGQPADQNGTLGGSQRQTDERPESGRVDSGSEQHRVHDGERSGGTVLQPAEQELAPSERKNTRNFRYNPNDPAPTSNKARYDANIAAIKLLKQLQDDGRQATPEEQRVLAKFTGWGGLGEFFKGEPGTTYYVQNGEKSPYEIIKELLTEDELRAAQLSRNSAYYTPAAVIDQLWAIAKKLGFRGGNILEGSAGIGNILSQMPQSISDRSNIQAVEIDDITAGILAQLYPDATTHAAGFQEVDLPNNSQDLVITNVPFVTGLRVHDSKEKDLSKRFHNIHDFCIAKNVRKLRQGGLGIFITSSGTLDTSKDLRRWLVNEGDADVIGAFRMNRETFGGTSATSDIIVVRKRVNGVKDPRAINVLDTETARVAYNEEDGKEVAHKLNYNKYFVEHPESMGGEMGFGFEHGDTRWGGTTAGCYPSPSINQSQRMQDWLDSMAQSNVPMQTVQESTNIAPGTYETYEGAVPYGSLILNSKGEICRAYHGMAVPVEGITPTKVKGHTKAEVLKDYNAIKAAVEELLAEQAKGISDETMKPLLKKLNKAYDDFVKKYGYLNRNVSLSFLRNDVQWASIAALENVRETIDKNGKKQLDISKTDVFSKRVVGVTPEPKAENAKDGIILSMQQYGTVRPDMIATWLGKSQEDVEKEMIDSRLAFRDPQTGNMVVNYEYLSGNVREKLAYAEEHNENGEFDTNIEELRKVIPVDIPAHLIEFNIGSTWIPVELYHQYLKEKFGVESLRLVHVGSAWISNEHSYGSYSLHNEKNRSEGVYSEVLKEQVYGHQLMIAAMNNVPVVCSKTYKNYDGTTETVTDKQATAACSDKIGQIKDDFVEWARGKMQQDSELAERVQKIYNDRFNAIVPMLRVDDAFLSPHLPGQNHKYTLYDHQQQAVVRATTQPIMLAHEVGTGKTITLISAAMEMRRLGTAKKPMIVVQNSTTPQFVKEAKDLYPNAKILTVSERDRTKEGRQEFYAKIKYNDWDLIIVPQSVFDMIPDSEARMRDFIDEKIQEKIHAIEAAKEANVDKKVTDRMERELKALQEDLETNNMSGKRSSKKSTEKDAKKEAERRANAEAQAQEMLDRRTDEVEDFDDMGIDALLIDEAHNYKHLGFATMMARGVKGIDPSYSKRAAALYLKCQSVYERCGHKNVVFATGTPISNTAAEIWTFMKYLMPKQVLKDNDIYYFDDFVHNFGKIAEQLEFATNGKFKANNRFAQYGNVPELMRLWLTCADCVLTREVGQVNDKVPQLEDGKAQDIFLPQSPSLIDIMAAVRAELERYEKMSGKEKKENSHIPLTMYGVAKRAAIDPRLVDENAADEPLSKTNKAVEETLRSLKDSKKYNGTVAIFCDSYQNKQSGFNLFEDIKAKLVKKGVPAAKIAIIRSEMTDTAKQKIFDAVREGEIRVIMGSTQTLGTGVNIQTRLHCLIHMDAPDRPMDYTQRNGRIVRQGNMHRAWNIPVRVLRFGVEDSLDVTSYQRLKTKAGFIDSIMNGKSTIDNNLENRVLEDVEEGIFDNPVAMLSGSQYALLKSQAERDLRKWDARKKQHEIDQMIIADTLKKNARIIQYRHDLIATDEKFLEQLKQSFPDSKVTEYNINGTVCHNAKELKEALKALNAEITATSDELRKNGYEGLRRNMQLALSFNGMPFNVAIVFTYKSSWEGGMRKITIDKDVQYTTPTTDKWLNSPTKVIDKLIEHIEQDYLTGTAAQGEINYSRSYIERLESENELMRQREGKPFMHQDELDKARALVDDYTKKMQEELAEKEAKYANQASARKVELNEEQDEDETTPEAQITDLDYPSYANQTEAQQLATSAIIEALNDNTDLDVSLATDEEIEAQKKSLIETATWSELMLRTNNAADVSTNDGAKLLQKIETTKQKLKNLSIKSIKSPYSFISDILGLQQSGSSYYETYKTKNGKILTLRISNHNATVSNFDNEGEKEGVSIIITSQPSTGIVNDGQAHIVEYFYRKKDLWNAYGHPIVDILDSIKELLETGEYTDTTGLATREEVNVPEFSIVNHNSPYLLKKADGSFVDPKTGERLGFDHRFMGKGEGGQAHGWGSYFSVEDIEGYAETHWSRKRYSTYKGKSSPWLQLYGKDHNIPPIIGSLLDVMDRGGRDFQEAVDYFKQQLLKYSTNKKATQEKIDFLDSLKEEDFVIPPQMDGFRHHYSVEIPENTGENYLEEMKTLPKSQRRKIADAVRQLEGEPAKSVKYVNYRYGWRHLADMIENNQWAYMEIRDRLVEAFGGRRLTDEKRLSEMMHDLGFVGVHYNGRRDGECYVIFNENDAKIIDHREFMRTPDGTLYGWAVGDQIKLTKDGLNPNTPIHEYTHLWAKAMRRNNREGWQSILNIFKDTPMWQEVKEDSNYSGLQTDDAICSEVLARYSGTRGAARMEEAAAEMLHEADQTDDLATFARTRRLISRVRHALSDFWHWVGVNLFGIKHFDSAEQVADRVLFDLLNQTELQPTDQTTTNNFKEWFGDWENDPQNASKVVDESGKPLVVYKRMDKDYKVINTGETGTFFSDKPIQDKSFGDVVTPVYLNIRKPLVVDADSYSWSYPLWRYLSEDEQLPPRDKYEEKVKNGYMGIPKEIWDAVYEDNDEYSWDSLGYIVKTHNLPYDGVIIRNIEEGVNNPTDVTDYIVFNSNQIKSATGNNGEFSTEDDDIERSVSKWTPEQMRAIQEWNEAHPHPQYQVGEKLDHYAQRLSQWEEAGKQFRASIEQGRSNEVPTQTERQTPAFVPGVKPTPTADESLAEYALRLKQYYQLMRDDAMVADYVAEINAQADAAAKVLKKNTWTRGLLDAAKPIENFQEWMQKRGATITDNSNAYTDTFLATGRVTQANEKLTRDIIRPLAKQIATIIAPDKATGKSRLADIGLVWQNMDQEGTGRKIDGKALTPREIIGVYCQAKDCDEAIENGLPDRGEAGFKNNVGMSYDRIIAEVESRIPRAELDELWRLINAATHFALNYDYESGRISEDTHIEFYQREFYVPQRGWRERDESGLITEYEPVGKRGHDPYNAALVRARGRKTLASDPFAYIMSIDASSIISSENNKIKQKFLQFCLDNEDLGLKTGAFRVKKYWIMNVIDPQTGKIKLDEEGNPMMEVSYVAPSTDDLAHDRQVKEQIKKMHKEVAKVRRAFAQQNEHGELSEALQAAYENKIAKMKQAIEDMQQTMRIAWHATNSNITQRTSDEKKQHEVRVLLDGQEYVIEVQDEKLANAINKKFKQHQESLFDTTQKMRNATRFMSAMLTQYNPEFAASNFARDYQVALATLLAEHKELAVPFMKNFAACQPAVWQYAFNDKVRDREAFHNSEMGRYLREYFESGAPTGFSYMQDLKSLRRDFDAMVNESNVRRGIKGAVGTFAMLTEVSETAVRFAGYVSARQAGWGINDAAYMSKELTTNFDRAGELADSGWMSWFSFFRATLNGNLKFLKALKKMPLAYSIVAASYFAMGMLNQFLNPDDPDDEIWASDYTRQSNFVIGKWRIPTAHFLRMFFAAGVNAAQWIQGNKTFGHAAYNTADFATQELLPNYLNMMNGTEWNDRTGSADFTWKGLLQGVMPSPVSPIADVWFNRDFRGATINREPFTKAQEGTKDILLSKDRTMPVYKWLTQTIYEGVGGNMNTQFKSSDPAWRSWLFDTSASSVEHVAEGYMPAGMDMFITIGEAIYDAATGTPTGPDKWPFVRKFYNAYTPERAYMQQYYLLNGRVTEFERNLKDYQKNDPAQYRLLRNSQEYRTYQQTQRLVKDEKENPTTVDVKTLIEANKLWLK